LLAITFEVELFDGLDRHLLFLKEDLIGLRREFVGKVLDMVGKGSREQYILNARWEHPAYQLLFVEGLVSKSLPLNPLCLVSQTLEVDHLVGLVKDKYSDMGGIEDRASPGEHVDKGTRSTDKDVLVNFDIS
jgi:hypothetical protein